MAGHPSAPAAARPPASQRRSPGRTRRVPPPLAGPGTTATCHRPTAAASAYSRANRTRRRCRSPGGDRPHAL